MGITSRSAVAANLLRLLFLILARINAFTLSSTRSFSTRLFFSDTATTSSTSDHPQASPQPELLSLSLPKPLGLLLEEVEPNEGVVIQTVNPGGSAYDYAKQLTGCRLATVQGQNVTTLSLDDVMQLILEAPAKAVDLQVVTINKVESPPSVSMKVGTPVTIRYQQATSASTDLEISAKVGDNLRQTLLDNGVEVYQGLKQKLGNCGGGGSCTFCAMDLVESEGWLERSDYEDQKLARFPQARLACLNTIQGPATIAKTQR